MSSFAKITANEFDPIFDKLDKQWMLISATDGKAPNTMTASWGGFGILWHKPVAFCFIRPQRHTCPMVENGDRLSLAFLPEEYRAALSYCGSHSGREGDKFAAAGLTCLQTEAGIPYPAEADTVLICRKLYTGSIEESEFNDPSVLSHYAKKDYHRVFICEIEQVLQKKP